MNKGRGSSTLRGQRNADSEPLDVGHRLRDAFAHKTGVILECACQYSHPKAAPVYNYLVRWDDGQVQAITEAAIRAEHGVTSVD